MWRKPAEAKPSSQSSEPSATTSVKPPAASPVATQAAQPAATPATVASAVPATPLAAPPPPSLSAPSSFAPSATASPRGATRISSGIRIKGEISGSDDLYIDGQAEGQFRFPQSKVTVGPNGSVKASIEAREIVIEGTVEGNLKASAGVQLGASSKVTGSLTAARIAIEDGARLRGKVEMTRAGGSKQEASAAAAAAAGSASAATASGTPQAIVKAAGE